MNPQISMPELLAGIQTLLREQFDGQNFNLAGFEASLSKQFPDLDGNPMTPDLVEGQLLVMNNTALSVAYYTARQGSTFNLNTPVKSNVSSPEIGCKDFDRLLNLAKQASDVFLPQHPRDDVQEFIYIACHTSEDPKDIKKRYECWASTASRELPKEYLIPVFRTAHRLEPDPSKVESELSRLTVLAKEHRISNIDWSHDLTGAIAFEAEHADGIDPERFKIAARSIGASERLTSAELARFALKNDICVSDMAEHVRTLGETLDEHQIARSFHDISALLYSITQDVELIDAVTLFRDLRNGPLLPLFRFADAIENDIRLGLLLSKIPFAELRQAAPSANHHFLEGDYFTSTIFPKCQIKIQDSGDYLGLGDNLYRHLLSPSTPSNQLVGRSAKALVLGPDYTWMQYEGRFEESLPNEFPNDRAILVLTPIEGGTPIRLTYNEYSKFTYDKLRLKNLADLNPASFALKETASGRIAAELLSVPRVVAKLNGKAINALCVDTSTGNYIVREGTMYVPPGGGFGQLKVGSEDPIWIRHFSYDPRSLE